MFCKWLSWDSASQLSNAILTASVLKDSWEDKKNKLLLINMNVGL